MYLLIGLAAGFLAALAAMWAYTALSRRDDGPAFRKILVASVDEPFTRRSIELAVSMAGKRGLIETFYVTEVPINRSLEVGAEEDTARGLAALEEASLVGGTLGKRLLPGLEKTRMGSKAVVELQRRAGFDLIVFDLQPGDRLRRANRKIAEYLQEKAGCTVMIVGGNNNK
jgi:hypothetical protein